MRFLKSFRTLMLVALAMTVASMTAANVDANAARGKAINFMNGQPGVMFMASPQTVKLTYAETSSVNPQLNTFYVFNYDGGGFVIVAGDDRAEEILGYGDYTLDMNRIPDNMRWWLNQYKRQIEFLQEHPDLKVTTATKLNTGVLRQSVSPLLTCKWDQESPYWNQCPTYGGSTCLTGCIATAMAQVMYYWKYPAELPPVAAYTTSTRRISMSALPGTTVDWSSMTDTYSSSSSSASKAAVATLMRYCGQAAKMDYDNANNGGSGATCEDQLDGMKLFSYNSGATCIDRDDYSATQWNAMMQEDLAAGRPILYAGDDSWAGGHAFVVDGWNGSKYHINWGWSGDGDNYFALDAFSVDGYTFKYYQQMLYQVYPEGSVIEKYAPVMADASNVGSTSFKATWSDQTPSENVVDYTLYVTQYDPNCETLLTESFPGITVSNDGNTNIANTFDNYCDNAGWTGSYIYPGAGGYAKVGSSNYPGSLTTPALDLSTSGGTITVKFNAKYYGSDASSVVISCGDASQTVALTANATDYAIVLTDVSAATGQKVTFAGTAKKKRFYIDNIEITTGDSRSAFKATETGDASSRVITGITAKNYTVNGLNQGGSYKFHVVANYTDGTSKESNVKNVTLEGTPTPTPTLVLDPETLTMSANVGETATATFNVLGTDLTGNVTLTLNDAYGVYTINPVTITKAAAEQGATVTVTYAPLAAGDHEATVTVASEGAQGKTVTLNGTAALQTTAPVMAAATNVTTDAFTATWTDATPAVNVRDYTLYVNKLGAAQCLFTETFDKIDVTADGTRDRAEVLDEYCDNAGWTGYAAYEAPNGGMKLGSGSKLGYLTTPALDLTGCNGTITVKLNAKSYGSDNTSITVSCGDASETIALPAEAADCNVVLTGVSAAADQKVTIASATQGKRFYIYNVEIYAGEGAASASRVITGITDKTYTVDGLTAGETYTFYVEANYTDGTKAASNVEQVTLEAAVPVPTMTVENETVEMSAAVLETATATINLQASNLTGDVTVTLNDETGMFTIEPATISVSEAEQGATITVTYAPTAAGDHSATVTLSSEGAEDVTVTINATAEMEAHAPVMLPADEAQVTTTSFRADWLDETSEQYVESYTLYVNKREVMPAGATVLTETFYSEEVPSSDSNIDEGANGTLDDCCDNAGWTGYGVYLAGDGGLKLGAGTKIGTLTTPALDLTNCGGVVTVKFNAKSYGSDASSVIVSCGEVADTIELAAEAADYTVVLEGVTASADQHVTFSCTAVKKRFYLYSVTIISGEEGTTRAITETGDADSRVITGITDNYYVVEGLTPGATYDYHVKALYIDGTEADSNIETVTLQEEQGHGFEKGDVNHDHDVNISDVSLMITALLNDTYDTICPTCADYNGDGTFTISDILSLISQILNTI